MSYARGDITKIKVEIRDEAGKLAEPEKLTLRILIPAIDLEHEPTEETREFPPEGKIVEEATGIYYSIIDLTVAGEWSYLWEAEGGVQVSEEGKLEVRRDSFAPKGPYLNVDWQPSVAEVAAQIRARTKSRAGNEVGTFNEETRPTAPEVEGLIVDAVERIQTAVGQEPCNDQLRRQAGRLASIYCAMLIEQSYFPEQTSNSGSSFKSLEALFTPGLKDLCAAVHSQCGTTAGGTEVLAVANGFDAAGIISRENPQAW